MIGVSGKQKAVRTTIAQPEFFTNKKVVKPKSEAEKTDDESTCKPLTPFHRRLMEIR